MPKSLIKLEDNSMEIKTAIENEDEIKSFQVLIIEMKNRAGKNNTIN
ncbi:MAG: hypothetical protein ACRYE9_05545 [Janthinobacterium lividum]